jgi:hypothetical protein
LTVIPFFLPYPSVGLWKLLNWPMLLVDRPHTGWLPLNAGRRVISLFLINVSARAITLFVLSIAVRRIAWRRKLV